MTVLIVDDARSDRIRFRQLMTSKRLGFEFAWRWHDYARCSVTEWFRVAAGSDPEAMADAESFHVFLTRLSSSSSGLLRQKLAGYSLVLLDLAWSGAAEELMKEHQFLSEPEGMNRAGQPFEKDEFRNIEGVALLEWLQLQSNMGTVVPKVWVTSAYVAETAAGIRAYLRTRYDYPFRLKIVHKWIDETAIRAEIDVARVSSM